MAVHREQGGGGYTQQRPPPRVAVAHDSLSTRMQPMGAVDPASGCLPPRLTGLTTRFARLRFIDREGAARKLLALEPGNGGFRRGTVGHLDEAKAFGAAGVAISNDTDLVHHAIL